MVIAPCSRMGPVTEDERNGLINHSPVYGKYEDEVDRESAYEMLQKGVQASVEQQNNPPAKGKEVAVDDGILGGLKDILFGTTGPRGGKKDGVVQNNGEKRRPPGDESDCTRDVGEFAGGEEEGKSGAVCAPHPNPLPKGARGPIELVFDFINNVKGSFRSLAWLRFSH
ncbi:ATPase [Escherichia coli]|uniref:ATPase n=1 Tax=Escherichia coli TaxID=562 RepID=A0A484YDP9_ECOLX|nr:ATPase [Escherichia coli]